MRRRAWAKMTNTNSTRKVTVGTVKKSQAIRSWTWLFRNAFQVGEDGLRMRGAILFHRGFGHIDTDLAEFADNVRGAPRWIRLPHILDQRAHLCGNSGPARLSALAQTPPMVVELLLLPRDHRARLDERQDRLPVRPQARQPAPEESISWPSPDSPQPVSEGRLYRGRRGFPARAQRRSATA